MDMQSLPIAQFAGIIYLAVLLFFGLLSLLIIRDSREANHG